MPAQRNHWRHFMDAVQYILQNAPRYGLDPAAVLSVAKAESGLNPWSVGDHGTSFGVFQLHQGGKLPPGKGREWAASPEGIDYALSLMSRLGARGLTGQEAIRNIVTRFEVPADKEGEIRRATGYYSQVPGSVAPPSPSAFAALAGRYPFDPLRGFKYQPLGTPGQGTHTVGNWQSDNAWDYGAPAGTPVYATWGGTIDPQHYGELASSGRFGGNRLTLLGPDNAAFYQHLGKLAVKPGQRVNAGDLLGYIGNIPGLSPHLHFGVRTLPSGKVEIQPEIQVTQPQPSVFASAKFPQTKPPAPEVLKLPAPPPLTKLAAPPEYAAPAPPPDLLGSLSANHARRFSTLVSELAKSTFA